MHKMALEKKLDVICLNCGNGAVRLDKVDRTGESPVAVWECLNPHCKVVSFQHYIYTHKGDPEQSEHFNYKYKKEDERTAT